MAMSADDPELYWFDPPERGILPVGGVHASRSLRRHLRRSDWRGVLNGNFEAVVNGCKDRDETWINAELFDLYRELFKKGLAHSLEIRSGDALVGGLFGIALGGAFFGESMFSARPNGSKAALVMLSAHLARCGFTLIDTQYPTEHLESMGGQTISRDAYHARLETALSLSCDITRPLPSFHEVLQDMTQTS